MLVGDSELLGFVPQNHIQTLALKIVFYLKFLAGEVISLTHASEVKSFVL